MKGWNRSASALMAVAIVLTGTAVGSPALAGEADVVQAEATQGPDGSWRFDVTVRHADTGWDHYADAFDVLAPDGSVLGTRVLLHPHENEQPFTRSLTGVRVPDGMGEVTIRAHDSVDGYGGAELTVLLPDG